MPSVIHRTRAKEHVKIYTNSIQLEYTLYDLTLRCGLNEQSEDGGLLIEEMGRVIMSLEHAKVLSRLLAETIERIEKQFGPIADHTLDLETRKSERGQ